MNMSIMKLSLRGVISIQTTLVSELKAPERHGMVVWTGTETEREKVLWL